MSAMLREHFVYTNSPFPRISQYLSLTEFEGRIVSYGLRFFPIDLWPKRKGNQSMVNMINGADRESEDSKRQLMKSR